MEIKNQLAQCPNGHYYNSALHTSCPFCEQGGIPPTEPFPGTPGPAASVEPYPSAEGGVSFSRTEPIAVDRAAPVNAHFEPTMIGGDLGVAGGGDPVVGWLVCVEGGDKGRDFRLHAGNNFVGRSSDRDVCLGRDPSVSGKHFSVSYDKRHDRYFVSMGEGKEIVYVNDEPLGAGSVTLQKGDRIEVAHTKLIFIPLDSELVTWEWEK